MSALSAIDLGTSLPATPPPIDPALEPASIRNGDQAAKKAYQEGLAFEDVLVNQLAQEMSSTDRPVSTAPSDGLGGSDGSGDSATSAGGLGGSTRARRLLLAAAAGADHQRHVGRRHRDRHADRPVDRSDPGRPRTDKS